MSLTRASATLNCQSTPRFLSLQCRCEAAVSDPNISIVAKRRAFKHCRVIELSSFSAIFNQLPCLGCVGIPGDARRPGLFRLEGLVESAFGVPLGVTNQDRLPRRCIRRSQQLLGTRLCLKTAV